MSNPFKRYFYKSILVSNKVNSITNFKTSHLDLLQKSLFRMVPRYLKRSMAPKGSSRGQTTQDTLT